MTIKQTPIKIFESPDGGKTIFVRESGSSERYQYSIDELSRKEMQLVDRWQKLKYAVFLEDPAIDDLIDKIQVLVELKK